MIVLFRRLVSHRVHPTTLGLIALLVAALLLRIYDLNWDEGRLLHPDELHIVEVAATRISFDWPPDLDNLLDPETSHLNPRSDDPETGFPRQYAYGALPLLTTELVAEAMTAVTGTDWTAYFDHLHKVGRALSAMFDTGTVLIIFLLGRRLFDRRVALYAATIYALTPMAIQLAHFFTTDSWLTFFVALTLLLAIRAVDRATFARFAAAGTSCGLALATKGSVVALIVIIGVAALTVGWQRLQIGEPPAEALWIATSRLSFAGLTMVLGFGLFEPYALARPATYLSQLRIQSGIVRGTIDVAFTRQYVGTPPFIYPIEQLVRWGIGPVAGLLCLIGVAIYIARTRVRLTAPRLIVGVWLIMQGLVVMIPETKFLRYSSPLLPALAICGGLALASLRTVARRRGARPLALGAAAASLIGILLWTGSFTSVYAAPHTRLEASRWIYAHVPNGAHIGVETWDDALPVPFGSGLTPWDFQYRTVSIDLYGDRPTASVADELYADLEEADYMVLASDRVERGVTQLPWRYPVQIRYYDLLKSGQLGFSLASEFSRVPELGPVRFDDRKADESFVNYDHPLVQIYKKEALVPRETYDALMAVAVNATAQPVRHADTSLLLDDPVGELPTVDDARWSAALTDNSAVALLGWIALLVALQFAGLPLARIAFGRFAEGGWVFARLIALLVAGWMVWIGASLEVWSFRAIWCWAALLLVAMTWLFRSRWRSEFRFAAPQRRVALTGEAVFWVVFAVFLVFRLVNPDSWHPYWGGEKPMEFAHLNAILRSAHFPPYDPWFAGGYINYYYYGLYLVAFCIKLTGIPSEIAFNLAQPTMMALLASAGFGVSATLARRITGIRRAAFTGGIAGTVLLVAIGNLDTAVQVIRTLPDRYVPSYVGTTWQGSRVIPFTINEFPFFTGLYADLHAHVVALPITVLVIALGYSVASEPRRLVVALSDSNRAASARRLVAVRLALIVIALGALFPTNAWDVAVYAALTAIAVFMATARFRGFGFRIALSAALVAITGGLAYGIYLPFHTHYVALFGSVERVRSTTSLWPFLDHWGALLAIVGFGVTALLLVARKGRHGNQPPIAPFIVLVVALIGASLVPDRSSDLFDIINLAIVLLVAVNLLSTVVPHLSDRNATSRIALIATAIGGVAAIVAVVSDRLPLALMIVFATTGAVLWLRGAGSAERYTGAMVAAAASVAGGVEIVFLADDLVTIDWYRMNTVFKFYNQVWVLLALVGGTSIAVLIEQALRPTPLVATPAVLAEPVPAVDVEAIDEVAPVAITPTATVAHFDARYRWSLVGLGVSGVLILASFAYPLLATGPRLAERFSDHPSVGTLNALAWMDDGTVPLMTGGTLQFAEDRAAIDWLNEHVDGSPVIAEASIGPYRCNGSRISIATGLPTIIGWERHETQQRYLTGLATRVADVEDLYASSDEATKLAILRKYDVRYVVVGQLERVYPRISGNDCVPTNPTEGITAFERMVETSLDIAFQSGTTTIYQVRPPSP